LSAVRASDALLRKRFLTLPTPTTSDRRTHRFHLSVLRITILRCGDPPIGSQAWSRDDAILHALDYALTVIDFEPDADPPKVLAIGPDHAGNLLEIIWLELADDINLVIPAMPLRATFYDLLPQSSEDMP